MNHKEKFDKCVGVVSRRTGVPEKKILSGARAKPVVDARHLLYYSCHRMGMGISYIIPYITMATDGKMSPVYNSIGYAIEKVHVLAKNSDELNDMVNEIINECS